MELVSEGSDLHVRQVSWGEVGRGGEREEGGRKARSGKGGGTGRGREGGEEEDIGGRPAKCGK